VTQTIPKTVSHLSNMKSSLSPHAHNTHTHKPTPSPQQVSSFPPK